MARTFHVFIILLGVLASGSQFAYAEEEAPLSAFMGTWYSGGDAFGQPAQSSMKWSRVLDGEFIRLKYSIIMNGGTDRQASFRGEGYYQPMSEGNYRGFWADSSGDLHPLKSSFDGVTLTTYWGVEGEKYGRTEYALVEGGVQVTDWIMTNGAWRQFNSNLFERASDEP